MTNHSLFLVSEIDLLDWHNLLEVNVSLAKLLRVPNLKVCFKILIKLLTCCQLTDNFFLRDLFVSNVMLEYFHGS